MFDQVGSPGMSDAFQLFNNCRAVLENAAMLRLVPVLPRIQQYVTRTFVLGGRQADSSEIDDVGASGSVLRWPMRVPDTYKISIATG
jgi:hypothetical protein